jgi:hypothetical protein
MIPARVVHRFNVAGSYQYAGRALDLPIAPSKAMLIAIGDGIEAGVVFVRVRPRQWLPGVREPALDVHTESEPADRLAQALARGWAPSNRCRAHHNARRHERAPAGLRRRSHGS